MSSQGIPRTAVLDRAIDVLAAVALAAEPASASALARSTGQPRATVSRTLRTLADRGLVAETAAGWVIGNELFRLARRADPHGALIESAADPLRRLRDRAGESALLAIVSGRTRMEIVAQLDGAHRLGVVGWVGAEVPLHASSAGKLVLAELSSDELEAWVGEARPVRLTARTVATLPALAAELRRIRRRGWAEIVDELEEGLVSLSAPVRDRAGTLVAAIGLSGPSSRLGPARRKELVPLVLEAAADLARELQPPRGG
jgi:DNA-binding IclR family transcriptional regulator